MSLTKPSNTRCANCNTPLQGAICHECGQKYHTERWTTPKLVRQFLQQLTNIERGFLYTARRLFSAPQVLVNDYWKGKTVRSYNPFRYMLIWTAINLLLSFWLGIDDLLQEQMQPTFVDEGVDAERIEAADQKFDTWLNALVILLLPFFSFFTKWFFPKRQKTYAEHLILNAFLMGQQSLITSFTTFLFYLFPPLFKIYLVFNFLIGLTYNTYVFKRVFRNPWWLTILKALGIGLLGMVVFFGLIAGATSLALFLS